MRHKSYYYYLVSSINYPLYIKKQVLYAQSMNNYAIITPADKMLVLFTQNSSHKCCGMNAPHNPKTVNEQRTHSHIPYTSHLQILR